VVSVRKLHLLVALLCLVARSAIAGYAYPSPPPTWGGSAGAWTYGGSVAANAPWVNGSAAASVTTQVGGKAITVPASMRLAANAGQFVARAALLTPFGRTAQFIAWAALAAWVWNEVDQRWEVPGNPQPEYLWRSVSGEVSGAASAANACQQLVPILDAAHPNSFVYKGVQPVENNPDCLVDMYSPEGVLLEEDKRYGTVQRYNNPAYGEGVMQPATQADADALPVAHPMPDAVAQAADDVMPLPQLLPELEPVAEPIGVPYERNGEPWQDRAIVEPRNDESSPWRVEQRVEAAPVDEGSPSTPQEQQPTFCESNPSSIACQAMDVPAQQDLAQSTRNVAVTPQSGWGADNAACPAARHITAGGHDIPIPFDMFCTYFGWLRYIIIAFAWLGAGFILLGRID